MINKLLNELKEVRENKDYKNYRTLSNILAEYINNIYFSPNSTLYGESYFGKEYEVYINILKDISNEIIELNNISTDALKNKQYAILKIITQSTINLKKLIQTHKYLCGKNYSWNK